MKFTDILMSSAHAYIIEARQGEARDTFVQNFIKGLNCQTEDVAGRPCNNCDSCRQIDAGTSMDVFHMEKSGKTGYKTTDAIAFIERLGMGSYGRHVIGVVDEADLLSEVIQNKLLKTLEEPEEGAVIILATSNKDNLLSTVRSRCNVIRVSDFGIDDQIDADDNIQELARQFTSKNKFYEIRELADKKIKSQEAAIELLGLIEDEYREKMIAGEKRFNMASNIELVETARMDIYRGMHYGKALRRLFLELA